MARRGFTVRGSFIAGAIILLAIIAAMALPARAAADPVVAAAGDIACDPLHSSFNGGSGSSNSCRQRYTSDLLVGQGLAAVLPLGDIQYYCGSYSAFLQSYDLSWGRVKSITRPAVGNHEYLTHGSSSGASTDCNSTNEGAAGYFNYFNGVGNFSGPAGQRSGGYYSFDVGSWHLIALNSNCSSAGGCSSSSPQGQWLAADLAANPNKCILAYWHIPLFSSGGRAASNSRPFWDQLYAARADVVLAAHDHTYERFAPQKSDGTADATNGIRQFVVGTGGSNHTSFVSTEPNSQVRSTGTYGVLKLTLRATSYAWQFVPEAGKTFTDSGSALCHLSGGGGSSDTTPPSAPTNLTASAVSSSRVDLSWGASTDNVGVSGYTVYRNGSAIKTLAAGTLSYSDTTVSPNTDYSYTVDAFDAAGNRSAKSNTASVRTPGSSTKTFTPVADAYTDASKPSTNFGTASILRTGVSPEARSYIRFNLSGLGANVTSAKLRIYAKTDSSSGFSVRGVTDNLWGETSITHQNRPVVGGVVGSTGSFKKNRWQEVNVTSLVGGNGLLSVALTSSNSRTVDYVSREASGSSAPQLVVTSESAPPAPDSEKPSTPNLLSALAAGSSRVDLSWSASTDNVGVSGYSIYRNGTRIATLGAGSLTYSDTAVSGGNTYSYAVDAFDQAGNRSSLSNSITVTTPSSQSLTFTPVADTYVSSGSPSSNYGTSTTLRTDASPILNSLLRFSLSGLGGSISSAKLRVYANSSNSTGYQVRGVSDTLWGETTTTYDNQPLMGGVIGSSGPVSAGTWTEVDVTSLVTGNGLLSMAMTQTSSTSTSFASRESGANAPQLIISF